MQLGFDTQSVTHARAALLLYAMYRSRTKESSLNGMETWDRCSSYIRAAALKSTNIGEFVQTFCKKADIRSIKPVYLKTDGIVPLSEPGELVQVDGIYNYRLDLFGESDLLSLFADESIYIIMLVRERIQREKEVFQNENEDAI